MNKCAEVINKNANETRQPLRGKEFLLNLFE